MLDKTASIILFIVGIINILPIIVFFDSSKTAKLYGVPIEGESLIILMKHRGVLEHAGLVVTRRHGRSPGCGPSAASVWWRSTVADPQDKTIVDDDLVAGPWYGLIAGSPTVAGAD